MGVVRTLGAALLVCFATGGVAWAASAAALPDPDIGKPRLVVLGKAGRSPFLEVPVGYSGPVATPNSPRARRVSARARIRISREGRRPKRVTLGRVSERVGGGSVSVNHVLPITSEDVEALTAGEPKLSVVVRADHALDSSGDGNSDGSGRSTETNRITPISLPTLRSLRESGGTPGLGGSSGGGSNPCGQDGSMTKGCQNVAGDFAEDTKCCAGKVQLTATCPSGTNLVTAFNAVDNETIPVYGIDTGSPHWYSYGLGANATQVWLTIIDTNLSGFPHDYQIYAACAPV